MTDGEKRMTPKRFVVQVGSDGRVVIKYGVEVVSQQPQPLASILRWLNDVNNIQSSPPSPLGLESAFLWMLCDDEAELAQIWGAYEKIYNIERYNDKDLKEMGRFLFDKLVGADAWQAIVDKAKSESPGDMIELAFQFDRNLQDLHRFNWELMCREDTFLARERVAFTRLVELKEKPKDEENGKRKLEQFKRPPKVLFVAGSSYTDAQVRPGAEYFALMRRLEKDGHTIHSRVLQRASSGRIREVMESWRPCLVHFICHGGVGDNGEGEIRGYLELQTEEKETDARFADGLLADLEAGGTFPTIVVLSACHSASLPEAGPKYTWSGAAHTGSLASELVAGGVPFVVGMGGSVSDTACRLFSRRFGQAILAGESLVAATAEGRWSAFVDRTPETIDWALPTLFMGAEVDAGFVPVECKEGDEDPEAILKARMDPYGIPQYPVFCGRHEFFRYFYELLSESPSAHRVLLIQTANTTAGIGRHRLLQELSAQALREGHVPVLISFKQPHWEPSTVARLAVWFLRAVATAREAFGLDPRVDECTLLDLMLDEIPYEKYEADRKYPARTRLKRILKWIEDEVDAGGEILDAGIAKESFQGELYALLDELRQPPTQIGKEGKEGRAVVLLNQVHNYGDAIHPLLSKLIGNFGLGRIDEPVSVVLCYSKADLTDATLKEAIEGKGIRWLQEELGPFRQEDDEDMLAYQQVMLNLDKHDPLAKKLWATVRNQSEEIEGDTPAFAYNPRAAHNVVEYWTAKLRKYVGGMPSNLSQDSMYQTIEYGLGFPPYSTTADEGKFLIPADDETKLRKLREQ
jgi:hypothetical protein